MVKVGIIGGSGLENIEGMAYVGDEKITTEYGEPSSSYGVFSYGDCRFYVLRRHGDNHLIAPHKVNYRANIVGFKSLGVDRIITFSTVGGINSKHNPGDILLTDNAIDFTSGRVNSFYGDGDTLAHIDLTYPFCDELRNVIKCSAAAAGVALYDGGTYVCTNGPRLETGAEIRMYGLMGADVVGMTLFPEVALAREAEMCYVTVAIVTNMAAGVVKSHKLTSDEIVERGSKASADVSKIIGKLASVLTDERSCLCKSALQGAVISK